MFVFQVFTIVSLNVWNIFYVELIYHINIYAICIGIYFCRIRRPNISLLWDCWLSTKVFHIVSDFLPCERTLCTLEFIDQKAACQMCPPLLCKNTSPYKQGLLPVYFYKRLSIIHLTKKKEPYSSGKYLKKAQHLPLLLYLMYNTEKLIACYIFGCFIRLVVFLINYGKKAIHFVWWTSISQITTFSVPNNHLFKDLCNRLQRRSSGTGTLAKRVCMFLCPYTFMTGSRKRLRL